jgi:hypothetical protein
MEMAAVSPELEAEAKEEKRWLVWCGLPMVAAAVFVALTFATGKDWLLGPAVALLVADIMIIVYLAMSSDTNATGETEPALQH